MPGPAPKPSSLAQVLRNLSKQPVPKLSSNLQSLSLSLAQRNAHYGARHFLKEDLPRIAYANPNLTINVTRKEHLKESPWAPELNVAFCEFWCLISQSEVTLIDSLLADGTSKTIDMTQKHSSAILDELLATASP